MQSWTLGFLCYNEEEAILKVLESAYEVAPKLTSNFEILVVNDGSSDRSLQLLEKFKEDKQPSLHIINHSMNKGIGEALISAYSSATKENVLITCGDGQFDIAQLIPYKEIAPKTVICFYRLNNTTYSIQRNYLSAINKYFNRFLIGIELKDVNWSKAFKGEELQKIDFEIRSSLVETEICAKLKHLGNTFIEVESKYLERLGGISKGASFKIVFQALRDLFGLTIKILMFRLRVRT